MADIILHRRSLNTGSVPTTSSLGIAQFAINVPDGKVFIHKSSSVSESIVSVVTTDSVTTGSITLTATASAGLFIGTFTGSFSGVTTNADTASVALRIEVQVQNKTGAAIAKGRVVRISGSVGDTPLITTASYLTEELSANTLGFAAMNIVNDGSGSVITNGVLTGVDTSGMTAGQMLYLSASGQYTTTEPTAPLHGVRLGEVLRVHASQGSIHVNIDNGQELGESHDVIDSSTTASFGDLLVKSGSVWINSKNLTGSYNLTGSLTVSTSLNINGIETVSGTLDITGSTTLIGQQTITGSLTVFTGSAVEFQVRNTGIKAGDGLADNHEFTGSVHLTGSLILSSSVIRLHQSASVSGTNIFGTASWADRAFTASWVAAAINREWHVSSGSGDDTTGDGSILRPFKTLARASSSLGNSGERIVLHSGTYPENVTFPQLNFTITTVGTATPGDVFVNGTLTFTGASSSNKLSGFTVNNVTVSGNQNFYLDTMQIVTTTVKSGTGYFEAVNSSVSQAGTVTISNSGICVLQNGKIGTTTISHAAAVVSMLNCMNVVRPVASAGILLVKDCVVYSLASGSAALSSSAAATVALQNSQIYNPNGGAERVILGGLYGISDVIYNRLNSTLSSSIVSRAHFQHIQADAITGSFTGSVVGTITNADTASFANTGFKIHSASFNSYKETTTAIGNYIFPFITGSANGAFLNYTVASASNARAGQVMAVWANKTSSFTEVTTTDIGNTSALTVSASLGNTAGDITYTLYCPSVSWSVSLFQTLI